MKAPIIYFFLFILLGFSCKENKATQDTVTQINQEQIPVMKTGKASSLAKVWIDSETGHKVEKLVDRVGDNRSFYFHNNPFLPTEDNKGWLMIFYGSTKTGKQLFSFNLETKEITQITHKKGNKKGEIVGDKTRKVYYRMRDSIFATHIDTHKTEFIYKFPEDMVGSIATLNADETLLGGVLSSKEEQEIFRKNPEKRNFFDKIYEAKLKRTLVTINVSNGKLTQLFDEHAWLNHEQFSPTDPNLFMYCHEGPWHKVDRIWNIDITTKERNLIHKRTVHREIAGHEFFSPDGKTIWFDLQIPRGETFYLAGKHLDTGKETRYVLKRNEWSIHYNVSPDLKTFAGDGGDEGQVAHAKDGQWIYHFVPKGDSLISTKLVNMKNHNYHLEPNVHFSPDGKQIIFRANFEGKSQIYAVDIQKHH
ncbi:oligogalacturonate lyase family protein [Thalassobellus sediminis]|uniref:oligogalacturonate lyase family protein n=1 Tax=Thalassobellus sediminis TaxID=3367753 RepID=UPI0037AB92AB